MALDPHNKLGEEVRDPHKYAEKFAKWKETKELKVKLNKQWHFVEGRNRDLLLAYLSDLELGLNMTRGVKRGPRSPAHIINARIRLTWMTAMFDQRLGKGLPELSENDVAEFFNDMRCGRILTNFGRPFKSTADYVKYFRAFWRWYIRTQKKHHGVLIPNITEDIDSTYDVKPPFTYFGIDDVRKLCKYSTRHKHRVMMWFLFDSGIRAPTEFCNVKAKDIRQRDNGDVEVNIRNETSKTFGRRIKLLLAGKLILEWIKDQDLQADDYLFDFKPSTFNRSLLLVAFGPSSLGPIVAMLQPGKEQMYPARLARLDFTNDLNSSRFDLPIVCAW